MSESTKYITDYSWRTIVKNVILLSISNTYRVSVSPIDITNPGASSIIEEGYVLVDNAGHIYPIIAVGTGTIDVNDVLLTGECPASGLPGIVCKTANKGRALYLPQGLMNYLDKSAKPYLNSLAWAVLWANDPNALTIPFTATKTPTISNYQETQLINGKSINLAEDYTNDPQLMLIIEKSDTLEYYYDKAPKRNLVGGLLDSITYSLPMPENGRIIISK